MSPWFWRFFSRQMSSYKIIFSILWNWSWWKTFHVTLYSVLWKKGALDICPNFEVVFCIFLCTPFIICNTRPFLLLKKVKIYLCSSVRECRLNTWSVLYIELLKSKVLYWIDYNNILSNFTQVNMYEEGFCNINCMHLVGFFNVL